MTEDERFEIDRKLRFSNQEIQELKTQLQLQGQRQETEIKNIQLRNENLIKDNERQLKRNFEFEKMQLEGMNKKLGEELIREKSNNEAEMVR